MTGKHTLIIGGTRGLGREIAKTLKHEGHLLSVVGRKLPDKVPGLPGVSYFRIDLTKNTALSLTLNQIVKQNGKLNHLIFCQRFRGKGDDWHGELSVSLTATKNIIERLSGEFVTSADRSIVVISSIISQFIGLEQPAGYHIAKAGLNQLVRYFAVILGPKGIRVNSVSPGTFIKEESEEFYLKNKKLQDLYKKITPLGRMNTSKDIANAVSFLVSEKSAFITGTNIILDGGISLHSHETLSRKLIAFEHPNIKRKK